jgi:hypothetical protein
MGGTQSQPKLSVGITEGEILEKLKTLQLSCINTATMISEYATNLPIFSHFYCCEYSFSIFNLEFGSQSLQLFSPDFEK